MRVFCISIIVALFSGLIVYGQIPPAYYDSAIGKNDTVLQQALHDIIDGHQSQTYSSLWTHFQTTDKKVNGKVWDMYSDVPGGTPPYQYTFVTDQCGNYNSENDCYNREHSFPKSWFNSNSPMYTDLFHLYPTDGYVNGKRANYVYGEVSSASWTSMNGSKVGPNVYPGGSGTAFEPIDDYKGDFARTYFYMATRYYGDDAGWDNNSMVNGSQLTPWALEMLHQWHTDDTVSQKELDRNNAVYQIQQNRNPFIDHPEWVDSIWFPDTILDTSSGTGFIRHVYKETVFSVFPNPASEQVQLKMNNVFQGARVRVYTSAGLLVYERFHDMTSRKHTIDISGWENGVYFVELYNLETGFSYHRKLIVL